MVGCQNHDRLVPVALGFHPVRNGCERGRGIQHCTNRIINVVVVIGPINVARFNHQPNLAITVFLGAALENIQSRRCHLSQRWILRNVFGFVYIGALDSPRGIVFAVGSPIRQMATGAAKESE